MKSPLADLLRQASADAETDPVSHGLPAERHEGGDIVAHAATVDVRPETLYIEDEKDLELATDPDATVTEGDNEADRSMDDEACLLPVLSDADVASSGYSAESNDGRALCRRHWIVRVGVWSPAIALLALSTAAGAYALYQYATVQNLNYDLGDLSFPPGRDTRENIDVSEWTQLRENSVPGGSRDDSQPEVVAAAERIRARSHSEPDLRGSSTAERASPAEVKQLLPGFRTPAFADERAAFEAYQTGDYRRAEIHYRAALGIDPRNSNALAGLAAVLRKTAGPDKWIPVYEKLLEQEPRNTAAASVLLMHSSSGDRATRTTRLKVLLQRHPQAAELHFALGLLAAEVESWAEARLAFLNAHRLEPANADYSFNAAVCMHHLGQYRQARSYYRIASTTADRSSSVDRNLIAEQLHKLTSDSGVPL
ncbi:MAG: hypothetical protein GXP15_01105 [Gammaproteobacteria bacterium]|nr:hypothetical protein [Gammaproteobacteria bacterium]